MSSFDARTTRERNGEMIFRGEATSPFDAPAPLRNGEMIFRGVAISSFDARALDFFGPLRGARGGLSHHIRTFPRNPIH